jgi:hypothetical protein
MWGSHRQVRDNCLSVCASWGRGSLPPVPHRSGIGNSYSGSALDGAGTYALQFCPDEPGGAQDAALNIMRAPLDILATVTEEDVNFRQSL